MFNVYLDTTAFWLNWCSDVDWLIFACGNKVKTASSLRPDQSAHTNTRTDQEHSISIVTQHTCCRGRYLAARCAALGAGFSWFLRTLQDSTSICSHTTPVGTHLLRNWLPKTLFKRHVDDHTFTYNRGHVFSKAMFFYTRSENSTISKTG